MTAPDLLLPVASTVVASDLETLKPSESKKRTERFLYVIGPEFDGAPVKIGVAANLEKRRRELQTGNPFTLKVLFFLEISPEIIRKAEGACHILLRAERMKGEWFSTARELAIRTVSDVVANRLWEHPNRRAAASSKALRPLARSDRAAVNMTKSLREQAEEMAALEGLTLSKWVERLIREAVDRR